MSYKFLVSQAARVAWETTMDGVAVASSAALRYGLFIGNHYADSERLCAHLEGTRQRRRRAQRSAGERVTSEPQGTLMPDDIFVIDARRPDEFEHSHIYSAVNCHYSEVSKMEELCAKYGVRKDQVIVTYCAVGLRSGYMAKQLRKMGYPNASVLFGGYYHWVNTGHPIYKGEERAHVVLPQHKPAGLLLPAHIKAAANEVAREVKEKSMEAEVKDKSTEAAHALKEEARDAGRMLRRASEDLTYTLRR